MEKIPFHIVQLPGGCQCLRKVELMLRMIPAKGTSEKDSNVKAIVNEDTRYTVEEISDIY
jgi:hypothetical protein